MFDTFCLDAIITQMSISNKEVKEEEARRKACACALKKEIIAFLRRKRLEGGAYYGTEEVEESLQERYSFAEDKFWFDKRWLESYLSRMSSTWIFSVLEEADYKGKIYRYRYKWLAKIFYFRSK